MQTPATCDDPGNLRNGNGDVVPSPPDIQNYGTIDISSAINSGNATYTDNHIDNRVDNSVRMMRNYMNNSTGHTTIINNQTVYQKQLPPREKRMQILMWLSTLDFRSTQCDMLDRRAAETGKWFLEHPKFMNWVKGDHKVLYCSGIPGAGKSMLVSIAIDYLKKTFANDTTVCLAYIYCSYKSQAEHTAGNLLGNLLRQLTECTSPAGGEVHPVIIKLYEGNGEGRTKPSRNEFLETIKMLLCEDTSKRVLLFVDALDELDSAEMETILMDLEELVKLKAFSLLVTSRPYTDIINHFQDDIRLDIHAANDDVQLFLQEQIRKNSRLRNISRRHPELVEVIVSGITQKASGMFLLAQLHLEAAEAAHSTKEIHEAIRRLPDKLDNAYDSILQRIEIQNPKDVSLAKRVLMWIVFSLQPLTVGELRHAVSILEGDTELDESALIFENDLMAVCAGLVTIDSVSGIVRLVHYTTQHYLRLRAAQVFQASPHFTITATCLTYLSFTIYENYWAQKERYRFLEYAVDHWGYHARSLDELGSLKEKILSLLEDEDMTVNLYRILYRKEIDRRFWSVLSLYNRKSAALALATHFGLYEIAIAQLASGAKVEGTAFLRWTKRFRNLHRVYPLDLAAAGGYEDLACLLLDNGARPKFYRFLRTSTLGYAAGNGHVGMVKLLLKKFKNIDAKIATTAIEQAVYGGHEEVVQVLLDNGIDANSEDGNGRPIIYAAAHKGYVTVLSLLLESGASVDPLSAHYQDAVAAAASCGHGAVVQVLLNNLGDKKLDPKNHKVQRALADAASKGYEDVVRILLKKGGDPMSAYECGWPWSALELAILHGHDAVVQLLLEDGTVAKSAKGSELLSDAVRRGDTTLVRLLLGKGVDVDLPALELAIPHGHYAVIQLLLEDGTVAKSTKGIKLLFSAVRRRDTTLVRLLLEKGADPLSVNLPALELAILHGHYAVIQLLLEDGTVTRSTKGIKLLLSAVLRGDTTLVRLLLEKGADPLSVGLPALEATIFYRHYAVIQLLLEGGTVATTPKGFEVLSKAVHRDEALVRLLEKSVHLDKTIELLLRNARRRKVLARWLLGIFFLLFLFSSLGPVLFLLHQCSFITVETYPRKRAIADARSAQCEKAAKLYANGSLFFFVLTYSLGISYLAGLPIMTGKLITPGFAISQDLEQIPL